MKVLFALYDKNDNFINCGFSLAEIGINNNIAWRCYHKNKGRKLYKIPLETQNDIFEEEDKIFIKEEKYNAFTVKEIAEMVGVSERTMYRKLKRSKL